MDINGLVTVVTGGARGIGRGICKVMAENGADVIVADINRDGYIDVIDVVGLVNIVLTPTQQNPDFTLEDINPVSEYYGQNIGPSFFNGNGQVSAYYFGDITKPQVEAVNEAIAEKGIMPTGSLQMQ